MTDYSPTEVERLIAEARVHDVSFRADAPKCTCNGVAGCGDWCPLNSWDDVLDVSESWCKANLAPMADQLEAARAEVKRLYTLSIEQGERAILAEWELEAARLEIDRLQAELSADRLHESQEAFSARCAADSKVKP